MLFTTTFAIAKNIETMDSHRELYEEIPTSSDDNVPIWEAGYKWIYDVEFAYNIDEDDFLQLSFQLSLNNLGINVVECTGDSYRTEFDDNVICDFSLQAEDIPSISGTFKNTEIAGYIIFETANLGIREAYAHIDGRISLIGLIPISIDGEVTLTFESSYNILDFPLYAGKNWAIPDSSVSIVGSISLPGIASIIPEFPEEIEINDEITIFGGDAECVGMESITVYAGTYNAYHISIDGLTNCYYAPVAGNIIKIAPLPSGHEFGFELKSTTYVEPGAPNKPDKPSGPAKIKSGEEHTYSTSTTDSEGDKIYYWFYWGDSTTSGWLGPYNSGDICEASHTWTEEGDYIVKVKAKDTDGHESVWSDPLSVSLPKNKNEKTIKPLFLQFLKNLIQRFPLLTKLLLLPVFEKLINP